ncbi:hypothetical protein [Chengkuizengella marina]|uniref:Uncharacterized protein n=1 Tax=Chengkuizengella marina TaxID=2507566 RepID=A0A6N9Q7Q4_9BACL|nr:hypothetical protein [Chengkuizengella marina]NBI30693.1 hypothetical protein [Chengkuizengella marina]
MYHQQTMNQSQQPQWMQHTPTASSQSQQSQWMQHTPTASNQFKLTSFRSTQQPAYAKNTNFQAGTYQPAGFVPSVTQATHTTGNQASQSHMTTPQTYRQTSYRSFQPSIKAHTYSQPTAGFTSQVQNQPQTYQPTGFVPSMVENNQQKSQPSGSFKFKNNQQQHFQPVGHVPSIMNRNQTTTSAYIQQQSHTPKPQTFHLANYKGNMPGHSEYGTQNQSMI